MVGTRKIAAGMLAVLAVLLAGCLLLPGKFGSDLSLRRDGSFSFGYKGEIILMALADPKDMAGPDASATFTPEPCFDDETIEKRPCTKDEVDKQKAAFDETQKGAADKKKQDADMMKAMLGGIDPSDPKAGDEFAARLMRQQGWKSVIHRGNGRFDVEYNIAGRLDHDFVFPVIEKMSGVAPFLTVVRRTDGTVRVEAPAFSTGGAASPMMAMMQSMGGLKPDSKDSDKLPKAEGTFAVVTDGEILANNTDEGPRPDAGGKRLSWVVNSQTAAAPTALVRLGN